MSQMWQRIIRAFGDTESAGVALLSAIFVAICSVGLFNHWLANGRYGVAAGFLVSLCAGAGICVRDLRRNRWSFVSVLMAGAWLLVMAAVLAYEGWYWWQNVGQLPDSTPIFP